MTTLNKNLLRRRSDLKPEVLHIKNILTIKAYLAES
jgi:hypothetical protein